MCNYTCPDKSPTSSGIVIFGQVFHLQTCGVKLDPTANSGQITPATRLINGSSAQAERMQRYPVLIWVWTCMDLKSGYTGKTPPGLVIWITLNKDYDWKSLKMMILTSEYLGIPYLDPFKWYGDFGNFWSGLRVLTHRRTQAPFLSWERFCLLSSEFCTAGYLQLSLCGTHQSLLESTRFDLSKTSFLKRRFVAAVATQKSHSSRSSQIWNFNVTSVIPSLGSDGFNASQM